MEGGGTRVLASDRAHAQTTIAIHTTLRCAK
jgi:hypothetical protein